MSHNALINGSSHGISGGKSLINGTGYKVSTGKTLINGTGKNIGFELPKKWYWNETVSLPSSNFGSGFSFTTPYYPHTISPSHWDGLIVNKYTITYETQKASYEAYYNGSWGTDALRTIVFDVSPTDERLINYLKANATPIYD